MAATSHASPGAAAVSSPASGTDPRDAGCGICWLKAFYEDHERQIRAFFGLPSPAVIERPDCP
jgi:hypothetical protein